MGARCAGHSLLERTLQHLPDAHEWRDRIRKVLDTDSERVGVHLGVFVEPYLEAILDGRKTIESRFALHRCAPYRQVTSGDVILLKRSGGPVVGIAQALDPDFYRLGPGDIEAIRLEHAEELYALDDEFWSARSSKRYATLIRLKDPLRIEDMRVDKRDRRGWVTLTASTAGGSMLFS